MTINTESTKRTYAGNGIATAFDYDFKIFVDSDLRVSLIDDVTGAETVQVLNTDYTVTGEGFEAGGKVTFVTPPADGQTVLILSDVPYTQQTDLKNQGRFFPETIENAFDRATRQALQLKEVTGRSLTLPAQVSGVSTELPIPQESNVIGWNNDGTGLRNFTAAELGTTLAFSNFTADTFTATAAQTDFTLSADPGVIGNLDVSIDGVTQVPTDDYSFSGTTLTFVTPMTGGERVLVRYGTALPVAVGDSSSIYFMQQGSGSVQGTVQQKCRESLSVFDFMSSAKVADVLARTTLYDHSVEIKAALQAAIAQKKRLFLPAGTYSYRHDTLGGARIEPTIANGDVVEIYGEGMGRTIIREISSGNIGLSADRIININVPNGVTCKQVTVRDLTLDKNGASNGTPPGGSGAYDWQQSHALTIFTGTTSGRILNVLVENVETLDKTGGGIVFAAGFIDHAVVRNCHGRNFAADVGQRGDLENQAVIDFLTVEDCSGLYTQTEPNVTTASGKSPTTVFRNCIYDTMEFEGFTADVAAQRMVIENCIASVNLMIRDMRVTIRGGRYQVDTTKYWRRMAPGSSMFGGTLVNKYDSGTNSISPFYPQYTATLGGTEMLFNGVKFEPGAGASGTTTGNCITNATVCTNAQVYRLKFVDCEFSPLFERTIDAYRAGTYEFIRCKFGGWATTSGAVRVGSDSTNLSSVTIDNCDFSAVTATYKVYRQDGGTNWTLRWRGSHKYSEYTGAYSGAGTNVAANENFDGAFVSRSVPTGAGIIGMRVRVTNAAYGSASEYIATTNSISASTWRMVAQNGVKKDTTANRPTPAAADIGLAYLDTTLDADGKPIWWNGSAWVDSTGATV